MTFDFCTDCGADYLAAPNKCYFCGSSKFEAMIAEEGCEWRSRQWPQFYPYWIRRTSMLEVLSQPADKAIVANVEDESDPESSFILSIESRGRAAIQLEEQQQLWCGAIESLAKRLAAALKMKPWAGETARRSPTEGCQAPSTVIKTMDYNTMQHWEHNAQLRWKDGLFDTEGSYIQGVFVHRPPSADDLFLHIAIPAEVLGRLAG